MECSQDAPNVSHCIGCLGSGPARRVRSACGVRLHAADPSRTGTLGDHVPSHPYCYDCMDRVVSTPGIMEDLTLLRSKNCPSQVGRDSSCFSHLANLVPS